MLTDALLAWYAANHRALPWRGTQDPYQIWLSEIILQQTRVEQGRPYYERFLSTYPTVQALAAAPDEAVMRLWQGLGYYSRARNLLATARLVAVEGWPTTAAGLQKLPGIGAYTAAAIASFAYGEAVPVLDGNVARVLSRWFDMEVDIALPATQARMRTLAAALMPVDDAATFNQAMMEFGALQCVPGQPACLLCPVQSHCLALAHGTVTQRPVKVSPKAKRPRHLVYLWLRRETEYMACQRLSKDIWQNLFTPLLLADDPSPNTLAANAKAVRKAAMQVLKLEKANLDVTSEPLFYKRHLLSHQELHITVWEGVLSPDATPQTPPTARWVTAEAWEALGKPIVFAGLGA